MNKTKDKAQDKRVTREIHKLFWEANFQDIPGLIICYVSRIISVAAYNILIPLVSALAIQSIINKQSDEVGRYAVWIIILSLVYAALWALGSYSISRNAIVASNYLQNKVYANFIDKDYDFYSNTYLGSLGAQVARLKDSFNTYGQMFTLTVVKQAVIIIAGVGVIAWQSAVLAIITIVSMIGVLGFTLWSSSWRLKFRRSVSEASSEVAGLVGDSISQAHTIKSHASEKYEQQLLQPALKRWSKHQFKSWVSTIPPDTGRMILAAIATAVLLVFSSRLYEQGKISIAIVALIQLYVIKLVAATLDIAQIVTQYEETMASAYQPMKTMLIQKTILDPVDPLKIDTNSGVSLKLENITYTYPDTSRKAVKSFSLDIRPGEKIGLVGYSGSGKTTISKLLLRFMDVNEGSILLNGVDIRQLKQQDLRSVIAYVPQEPMLFHRSVIDNIAYGDPKKPRDKVIEAAKMAYADDFINELPEKYETFVGERGVKLSGGQRQRVALARAILRDAPILVLDEATSALDSESERLIQKALWELMKSRMAIVIAHRLSTIKRMDRIIVMDKGVIAQIGTHEELLQDKDGIYARLWAHQSDGYIVEKPIK